MQSEKNKPFFSRIRMSATAATDKSIISKTAPTIALILLLAFSTFTVCISIATAHTPPLDIPTYAYIEAYPDPIGVNQPMNLFAWLDKFPPTASGEYGDRWEGLTITVWKPDGTQEIIGPMDSDPVGTIFQIYTPTQTGQYSFQFNFPGQTLTGKNPPPDNFASLEAFGGPQYIGDYFKPSQSDKVTVTVQQQPIPPEPITPLPTGYWTRPISGALIGWQSITGSWLGTSTTNPYTTAPDSAHIVWTKPITFGGVATGTSNDAYYTGMSYEGYWSPPIIINGVLYYNTPNPPIYGFHAVDLRTGQELWYQNNTVGPIQVSFGFINQNYPLLSFGQLLNYNSPNQHGVIPYLWSTYTDAGQNNWAMYDAFTGNWICTLVGVPSGGAMFGASNQVTASDGSILLYNVDLTTNTISVWNSTAAIQKSFPSNSPMANNGYWMWRPTLGGFIDASLGIQANVSLSTANLPPFASNVGIDAERQIMLFSTGMGMLGMGTFPTPTSFTQFAVSLKPESLGQVLWIKTNPWPEGNVTLSVNAIGEGIYAMFVKETRQWYAYDINNGNLLWGPSEPETALHMYGVSATIYNGKLYSSDSIGEGGTIYCYDPMTGDLLWSKQTESMGNTGYWPRSPVSIASTADGKLFTYGSEHSPGPTLEPGMKLRAFDADTGAELWNITFWFGAGMGSGLPIADGYLVALNSYDNQIYCFGKGQTATTISVPDTTVPQGMPVTIKGTITDQSPGAKDTPAIADEYMGKWMEHLYMQMSIPENAQGVTVKLTATDQNGNKHNIGTVTSDMSGMYATTWTPPASGLYTIVATFEGSNSYFASSAQTALGVGPASAATSPTSSPSLAVNNSGSLSNETLVIAGAASVIIIAIIAIALLLKRRTK